MWDRDLVGTHILVPLDGSELAERALPAAEHVASALHATLVLARITPPVSMSSALPDGETEAQVEREIADEDLRVARVYLDSVAWPLRERGLQVQTIIQQGVAGPALVELLTPLQIGLVVMTTHGRSGMARFALGSVADHLVRSNRTPVFLLRPLIEDRRCERLDHAVIPLDGSARAEAALSLAAALSGSIIRTITLLRVVPRIDGVATERAKEEANRYIEDTRQRLAAQVAGYAEVETQVIVGDPADQIIRRVESGCDLALMSTRGETGTRRWAFGSVADRVLHDSATPLVLIQPPAEGERQPVWHGSAIASHPGTQPWGGMTMNTEHEHEHAEELRSEEQARASGSPGDGKGRVDAPGHTGVYPLSASEGASGEALVRSEPSWGQGERGAAGYEDSGDSGVLAFMPEQEGERDQPGESPEADQGASPSAP